MHEVELDFTIMVESLDDDVVMAITSISSSVSTVIAFKQDEFVFSCICCYQKSAENCEIFWEAVANFSLSCSQSTC